MNFTAGQNHRIYAIRDPKTSGSRVYSGPANRRILEQVPPGVLTVLDLGCGTGNLASVLSKQGMEVDGITLTEVEAEQARRHCRAVFLHNLEEGLPSELADAYDLVVCAHVLEHIAFPDVLLNDIRRIMQKGTARLLVALPNAVAYKTRLHFLLGRFEYADAGIMDYTHLRWYTLKTGKKLLEQHGFFVERAIVGGDIPCGRLFNFFPKPVIGGLTHILHLLAPGLFGQELVYVARVESSA